MYSYKITNNSVEIILKLVGSRCNIDCMYCYEKRKNYSRDQLLSVDDVKCIVNRYLNFNLVIGLHGGEPLLYGKENFRLLFSFFRQIPIKPIITIQTNGLILDQEWIDFLKHEWPDLNISLSMDGPKGANFFRVNYDGTGTIDRVESAIKLLNDNFVNIGIISCVNKNSLGQEKEILDFLVKFKNIKLVSFVPLFDFSIDENLSNLYESDVMRRGLNPSSEEYPLWGVTPMEYSEFLSKVYNFWKIEFADLILVEPFFSYTKKILGKGATSCHFSSVKCSSRLTIYPDGKIGTCDEFNYSDGYLGTVEQFSKYNETTFPLNNWKMKNYVDFFSGMCSSCEALNVCGGGCIATRIRLYEGGHHDDYCKMRIRIRDLLRADIELNESLEC